MLWFREQGLWGKSEAINEHKLPALFAMVPMEIMEELVKGKID
jgi:hypothetical protein